MKTLHTMILGLGMLSAMSASAEPNDVRAVILSEDDEAAHFERFDLTLDNEEIGLVYEILQSQCPQHFDRPDYRSATQKITVNLQNATCDEAAAAVESQVGLTVSTTVRPPRLEL